MSRYFTPAVIEVDDDGFRRIVAPEVTHWDQMYADLSEMCGIAFNLAPISEAIALSAAMRAARALVGERVK